MRDRSYVETPLLINPCSVTIDQVVLQVTGPFRIKELYEDIFEKEITIKMNGNERKEIFIVLNRGAMKQLYCRQVEGRVNVYAVGKQLRPLSLRVSILVPDVVILQPEIVLFDRGSPYDSNVHLVNQGCLPAEFKWKRLETREVFIGDKDDPGGIVADLLSEILRMLEYNFSCSEESNMTKRYQECRCQFRREVENGDMILEILDEIVNELDLTHRPLLYPVEKEVEDDPDQCSSSMVRETINDILARLHIDSSDKWSEPSTEYCFANRFIYFHEKSGTVEVPDAQATDLACKLHLPHIRRNFEMRAIFELSVIGGRSQRLSVALVNLGQKVKFYKDSTYMGIKVTTFIRLLDH